MCGAMYEVLAAPVEVGVWNTGAGIHPLEIKKGELVKGSETGV